MTTGGVEYRRVPGRSSREPGGLRRDRDRDGRARHRPRGRSAHRDPDVRSAITGKWKGANAEPFATAWQRVRVEVRNGTSTWVPLIDGPVVKRTVEASGEPGVSTLTIVARDDSVYLNRHDHTHVYEDMKDDDIAKPTSSTSPSRSATVIPADPAVPGSPERSPAPVRRRPLAHGVAARARRRRSTATSTSCPAPRRTRRRCA